MERVQKNFVVYTNVTIYKRIKTPSKDE